MLSLPWNVFTKDEVDLDKSEKILNESHFGLEKVKERILEYIAVKKVTKEENAPILCLVGPPGVGKTTLAFSIAKALNKNFVKESGASTDKNLITKKKRKKYIDEYDKEILDVEDGRKYKIRDIN